MISPNVVAAMCGCWARESTVNPGIWESLTPTTFDHQYNYDGIGGYGLGQWTNVGTPYGRCWNLHQWVTSNGYTDGDGDGQLAYVIYEDYWLNSPQTVGTYTNLQEFLNTTETNLNVLVWDFLANWEGVPGDAYEERYQHATTFYDYILLHLNDDPNDYTWITGNFYLNSSQMLNNVMCIYFRLSSGFQPKKRGMPVWMMLKYLP